MELKSGTKNIAGANEVALPEFGRPPINEVVCGVLFKSIDKFLVPYFGLLWDKFKAEYPRCEEAPPIIPLIEHFGEGAAQNKPEFAEIPPLPRVWFVNTNGNGIIQIQRDRFLHNWRKLKPQDTYPRYGHVFGMYEAHLATLRAFLEEQDLGTIDPLQYEMTYVNHIYKDDGWASNADIGTLFADFVWRSAKVRFLPQPEGINWRTTFVLPNQKSRLHVSIQNGESREDNRQLIVFELTVRGIAAESSAAGMKEWFEIAHEWIVRGFADLTDETAQKTIWGRKTR